MLPTLYAALTASPLWWIFLLCSLGWQFFATRKKSPSWKLRLWQVILALLIVTAALNLVHRVYAPADKYVGALFFMGIACALLFWANHITHVLTHRKPNSATLALLLGWLLSAPAFFIVSGFCLLMGLSILLFVP